MRVSHIKGPLRPQRGNQEETNTLKFAFKIEVWQPELIKELNIEMLNYKC